MTYDKDFSYTLTSVFLNKHHMKLLAIDTSASACSLALFYNNEIKMLHHHAPMRQAQEILPLMKGFLDEHHVSLNQLNAIAFGCGPGSFTGIRIATSVSQGLGYALNLPLIPISSLAAMAQTAYNIHGWRNLFVAIDARIQEVYCAHYQINSDGLAELIDKEMVCIPANMPSVGQSFGVGNAWDVYLDQIKQKPVKIDAECQPTAGAIIQLALAKYDKEEFFSADQALPVYLRDEVATKENKR